MSDVCKNCGAPLGLHHYKTYQCPKWGLEAPPGQPQKWEETVFEPETSDDGDSGGIFRKFGNGAFVHVRKTLERAGLGVSIEAANLRYSPYIELTIYLIFVAVSVGYDDSPF